MTKLKAGVIGMGVGEQHVIGLMSAGVEVKSICDFDQEKRQYIKSKYSNVEVCDTAAEMIVDDDLDIVAIASYDHHHAEQVLLALDHGKHVFCEKPICTTFEEIDAIKAKLAENPHLKFSTNTVLRLSPRFVDLKAKVNAGHLGEIYKIDAEYVYGRLHKLVDGWRGEVPDYSVMLGGGVHLIDLIVWMVGSKVSEVFAYGNSICSKGTTLDLADIVTAVIRFDSGVVANISSNYGCVRPHFHKFDVYGTEATFVNESGAAKMFVNRDPEVLPVAVHSNYPSVSKGALIASFVNEIENVGRAVVQPKEAFAALEVCLAIDKSLKIGRPVLVRN